MGLTERYDALLNEARAILETAKSAERAMSAEETATFDAKMDEAKSVQATLDAEARLTAAAPVERRTTLPERYLEKPAGQATVSERKREPGEVLGLIVRSLYTYGPNKDRMLVAAERAYGGNSPEYRALGVSDFTAGGALVPEEFAGEIIPLLQNIAVFRRAGARTVPLRGTLEIPRMTSGVTASWVGENTDRGTSEPAFGSVKLIEKTLSVVTPVSNDLLRLGTPSVDVLIRDNIVRAIANAEDAAFLMGTGTEYSPRGLYYQAPSAHVAAISGTALANIRADIRAVVNLLAADNVPADRRVWLFNPRSINYMKWDMVDANSNFSFPELRANNTLNGWPVFETNNITTETNVEWYLVEMSGVYIGDGPGLEIKLMDGAAYYDSTAAAVVSGLSRNQTVISALKKTDMVLAYANGVAVRHTCTY